MARTVITSRSFSVAAAMLGVAALSLSAPGLAQEADAQAGAEGAFGNPTYGDRPCVFVGSYETTEAIVSDNAESAANFLAEVVTENTCGRTVEVRTCIGLTEVVDDSDELCTTTMLRPWSDSGVQRVQAPVAMTGASIAWRWWSGDGMYGM